MSEKMRATERQRRSGQTRPAPPGNAEISLDIYDPDGYVDAPPHEAFEALRREQPVYRQPMPDGTAYWAVLRHPDVVHVARHPTVFSASLGGVVLEDLSEEQLAMMRDMVLAMDPPRHVDYRRNL